MSMTYQKFLRLADSGLNPGSVIYQSWANQFAILNFTFLSVKWGNILFFYMAVLLVGTNGYTGRSCSGPPINILSLGGKSVCYLNSFYSV